ncbi:unnamed protein product [Rotaria sp. Silwood2]|nr:unnamed protein product [Rotaria sp. Silwood2]CAF2975144.1 unnamed protein product [Rotaria sp. Silwood2]CAF4377346.1 unnamed protein product [Rotaria sp. Silwood2]CAF4435382.1 unnamed protein product [Rotaria sp. Silwood2]
MNRFYYNGKIYRFSKGGPANVPLIQTLSEMFATQWQKSLRDECNRRNEFLGRCKDEIILTWNSDMEELQSIVKQIHIPDTSIEIQLTMASKVQFLDAYIENKEGLLYSRVDHHHGAQPYTLPYAIANSKAAHSHWLRSSRIRAVRYFFFFYLQKLVTLVGPISTKIFKKLQRKSIIST